MLKKRLISVLLAAGVVAGVATATGCKKTKYFVDRGKALVQPNLIVACIEKNEQNKYITKLHKSDKYVYLGKVEGDTSAYVYGNYYDFFCSKDSIESDQIYAYPDGIPQKSVYDEMCDICFPEYSKN